MKKTNPLNTTQARITAAILITSLLLLVAVNFFMSLRVATGFRRFLREQDAIFEITPREERPWLDEKRLAKHQRIEKEFSETVKNSMITAGIAGFGIATIVGLYISDKLTNPLKKLKKAVRKVRKNRYQGNLRIEGTEEVKEVITEFNKLLKELARVESLREELVSDVAHELKTPLTKVKGQLEGMQDGIYKPTKKHLAKMNDNLDYLEDMIQRLQELVQIRAKKVPLKFTKIKLKKFAESISSNFEKKQIKFVNNVPNDLFVKADRNKLRGILENLLENSYKYTKRGEVEITADQNKIVITDTGSGIPKKDLPYIFERFYRVEKSRNRKTGGMGLGLAIVKELVEAHGWKITVRSKLGKGSKFLISMRHNP